MTSKKKRLYVGLMLTGAAALFCDRFLLSRATGPEIAEAVDFVGDQLLERSLQSPSASAPIPELPFPRDLRAWDPGEPVRDLFSTPSARQGPDSGAPDKSGAGERGEAATFAARHSLNGVLIVGRARRAVVDEKVVEVDDVIEGCKVVDIEERKVRFVCTDGEAALTLPEPERGPRK